jgi:hypothetical protein
MRPIAQHDYFMSVWNANQTGLYNQYLDERLAAGESETEAMVVAFNRSIWDASGSSACTINAPAAGKALFLVTYRLEQIVPWASSLTRLLSLGWFWFTVLSTVGKLRVGVLSLVGILLVSPFESRLWQPVPHYSYGYCSCIHAWLTKYSRVCRNSSHGWYDSCGYL